MILIGSKAIQYHYHDFKRNPKDIDYAVLNKKKSEKGIEYLVNPIIYKYESDREVASAIMLTTLKASHLCWDINWEKHMFDLQFLLSKGNKIDKDIFIELYNYWNQTHVKNKRSDLKMSKEDFFDNAINYSENQHDDLHKILNPIPIYTLVLADGKEVELDELKFHNLTYEQKLDFVREEVMVMAYERYSNLDYRVAYSKMLKKFIISHAPLFSLIFILENYIKLHKPIINYLKKIKDGLQETK